MLKSGNIPLSPSMNSRKYLVITVFIAIALAISLVANSYQLIRNASLVVDVATHSFHCTVYVQRVGEDPQFWSEHTGQITNIGKDFIKGKLSNSAFTNATAYMAFISLSTSVTGPSATWRIIPSEIVTNELERAEGTYASTGVGTWTVSHQFTASGTETDVQLTGINWLVTLDASLCAADTFTPVTLNNGDKITVTWTITAA